MLSQVQIMNIITHLHIMQLNYPASISIFFGTIFGFVTFDILPVDNIYGAIFDFDSEPYTETAAETGYESLYMIENTGCLLIFLFLILVQQSFLAIILKYLPAKFKALRAWAIKKRSIFLWAGLIDFFGEMYLNCAFSIGINLTSLEMTSPSIVFNNVFCGLLALVLIAMPLLMSINLYKTMGKDSLTIVEQFEGGEKQSNQDVNKSIRHTAHKSENEMILQENEATYQQSRLEPQNQEKYSTTYGIFGCCKSLTSKDRDKLIERHKNQLEILAKIKITDRDILRRYGSFVGSLTHRRKLSHGKIIFLVLWKQIRILILAAVILALHEQAVCQLAIAIALSLCHIIIISHLLPYTSKQEQRIVLFNELSILLVLYCLLLFVQDFVKDNAVLEQLGLVSIGITVLNFLFCLVRVLRDVCCVKLRNALVKCKIKLTLRKRRKQLLKKLANRN